ncbi:MAG: hypothetical protein GXO09_00730 [Crenarchaeota archaeon]|nr:hypothetical protein [Thermoproteota archaeon]
MQAEKDCIEALRLLAGLSKCIGANTSWARIRCVKGRKGINLYLHTISQETLEILKEADILSYGVHIAVYTRGRRGRHILLPSLGLLNYIRTPRTYVRVNRKAAILFTYGRDILPEGIIELRKPPRECPNILPVLDEYGEPIGWGRLNLSQGKPIIENLLDVGWYLRSGV